ncbi:MarR family winged helix-turn-helix transcriptional regulator [Telmatospirillum sp. J64-1]|uniref:MarR family winged helix-turn-helix transcriptional regulator n=1 Tax=Telmatospirillum sp. J64-1 TaxID=2502183 RepID=UPI00115CE5BB|nr:MarR family transcriptional regulator [Telmatospirillum sp. J64-1]
MQSSSPSPRARFGFQFVVLARRWRRALDERLAALHLTDATWAPLVHLAVSGEGINQKDLAALVGIEGSSLVRLLDILVSRGLIERRMDPADRRAKLIFLTPAGRQAVTEIRQILVQVEEEILADLSDAEIESVLDIFGRIDQRLQILREEQESRS